MIWAAFSPMISATVVVFVPRLDGHIERSEPSALRHLLRKSCTVLTRHLQALNTVHVQVPVYHTVLFPWPHRASGHRVISRPHRLAHPAFYGSVVRTRVGQTLYLVGRCVLSDGHERCVGVRSETRMRRRVFAPVHWKTARHFSQPIAVSGILASIAYMQPHILYAHTCTGRSAGWVSSPASNLSDTCGLALVMCTLPLDAGSDGVSLRNLSHRSQFKKAPKEKYLPDAGRGVGPIK